MLIELLTPEEEIIAWFEKAMTEELPEMIQKLNEERGEQWAEQLAEISRLNSCQRLPHALIQIPKEKKETVDINFTREEYIIELKITFIDNEYRSTGYRYNFLLGRLIKESAYIKQIADRIIIDEFTYNQNNRGDSREPSSVDLKIIVIKETA